MHIGELAVRANVSRSRIRFYERNGVLPPPVREPSGYRSYDEQALEILYFVERAQSLGFSLQVIAQHLRSQTSGQARKASLAFRVEGRLEEVDAQLNTLQEQRQALLKVLYELRANSQNSNHND